LNNKVLNQQK